MSLLVLSAALAVAFGCTLLAVPVVRRLAILQGWVDHPDAGRKVHERPTPNVGGLAVAAGLLAGLVVLETISTPFDSVDWTSMVVVVLGGIAMLALGFIDDVRKIGFKRKFLVQLVVAYAVLLAGYRIDLSSIAFFEANEFKHAIVSIPLTLVWIIGITNAVNLLDGLDGLAAGVALIAFAGLAAVMVLSGVGAGATALALLMVAALAGFLVFNFPPASIFLGDSGSLFIGYILAVYSMRGNLHADPSMSFLIPAVILGLPILDTSLCMIRRLLLGRSPYSPDNDHIHHRLGRLISRERAVVVLYVAAAWFTAAGLMMATMPVRAGLLVAIATLLAAYVGIRTLGYLDVSLASLNRLRRTRRTTTEKDIEDAPSVGRAGPLRRGPHHDAPTGSRMLPVRIERHRAPWRREVPGSEGALESRKENPLLPAREARDGTTVAEEEAQGVAGRTAGQKAESGTTKTPLERGELDDGSLTSAADASARGGDVATLRDEGHAGGGGTP